jgi:hypothetical protein
VPLSLIRYNFRVAELHLRENMDTNKVSKWASIFGIPMLIGWYITDYQTFVSWLRTEPNSSLPSIFMGAFVTFGVITFSRERSDTFKTQQASDSAAAWNSNTSDNFRSSSISRSVYSTSNRETTSNTRNSKNHDC